MVTAPLTVRPARVEDVAQMARVNVRSWQEAYRGLMPDAVLDDPGFVAARERFWTVALTDERYRANRVAVAEREGELVGIAMSGPPLDADAAWARQLYVLYVYAAEYGTGAGAALMEAGALSVRVLGVVSALAGPAGPTRAAATTRSGTTIRLSGVLGKGTVPPRVANRPHPGGAPVSG